MPRRGRPPKSEKDEETEAQMLTRLGTSQQIQIVREILQLFQDDPYIDQYQLRRWAFHQLGVDLTILKGGQPVVPEEPAREEPSVAEAAPVPSQPVAAPSPAVPAEPTPEPVGATP